MSNKNNGYVNTPSPSYTRASNSDHARQFCQGCSSWSPLAKGDAHVMGREEIHTAYNPSKSLTGAIHIYEGDFLTTPKREWDPITHEERPRIMAETFAMFDLD